jgi:hypothetical protein
MASIYQKHIFLHAPYHVNGTTLTATTLAADLNLGDAFIEVTSSVSFPNSGTVSVNGVGSIVYAYKDDGANKLYLAEPSTLAGVIGDAVVLLFDIIDTTKDKDGKTFATCVRVKNLSAVNSLNVSFDGGTNYFPISPSGFLSINAQIFDICVTSSVAVSYNILCMSTR